MAWVGQRVGDTLKLILSTQRGIRSRPIPSDSSPEDTGREVTGSLGLTLLPHPLLPSWKGGWGKCPSSSITAADIGKGPPSSPLLSALLHAHLYPHPELSQARC